MLRGHGGEMGKGGLREEAVGHRGGLGMSWRYFASPPPFAITHLVWALWLDTPLALLVLLECVVRSWAFSMFCLPSVSPLFVSFLELHSYPPQ